MQSRIVTKPKFHLLDFTRMNGCKIIEIIVGSVDDIFKKVLELVIDVARYLGNNLLSIIRIGFQLPVRNRYV